MKKKNAKKPSLKQAKQLAPLNHSLALFGILAVLLIGTGFVILQSQQQQNIISKAAGDCTVSAITMTPKQTERDMFDLINTYRRENNVPEVAWGNDLKRAAEWLSLDMSSKSYVSHTDSLGRDPATRLIDCGFTINEQWGENIIGDHTDPTSVMNLWESDEVHKTNLLDTKYTQVGIAYNNGYWVADFGTGTPTELSPTTEVTPTQVVPSPNCLGASCVTPTSEVTPTEIPTATLTPELSGTQTPLSPTLSITAQPTTTPGNGSHSNGIFGFILQFLLLLLQFLQQLFK